MPGMPKLNRVLELRIYMKEGVSSRTIYGRLEANTVEYQARSSPTRTLVKRYRVRYADGILSALLQAEVTGPVRIADEGVELVVHRVEELDRHKMMFLTCEGVAQLQPTPEG